MKIQIKHFDGQYPSFNVQLFNEGDQPFLEIKGCKIVSGANGEFVSWPSRKLDSGKYWNHCYASEAFNAAVLKLAKNSSAPAPQRQAPKPKPAPASSGFDDMDSDVPF